MINLRNPTTPNTQGQNPSASASDEIQARAPWRLSIDNRSNPDGCIVTLRRRDSDWTWTNPLPVHSQITSFQFHDSGVFQLTADPGCVAFHESGAG